MTTTVLAATIQSAEKFAMAAVMASNYYPDWESSVKNHFHMCTDSIFHSHHSFFVFFLVISAKAIAACYLVR